MTGAKPVVRRALAEQDIEEAIDRYLTEGGADLALRFVDALEAATRHIARHPATGSPRYATAIDLPGLRFWPLKRFPQLVFYVEHGDAIDAWRVLHGQRDIPAWLSNEPDA